MNSLRTLEQVEADVRMLSPPEQAQLRGWLEDLHEDRLELHGRQLQLEHSWRMIHEPLPEAEADQLLKQVFPE